MRTAVVLGCDTMVSNHGSTTSAPGRRVSFQDTLRQTGVVFYDGEWRNDKMSGLGAMVWLTENGEGFSSVYDGEWREDLRSGYGVFNWSDFRNSCDKRQVCKHIDWYAGQWLHGRMHGLGIMHTSEGSRYVGQWDQDQKHGLGMEGFSSGGLHSGMFLFHFCLP